jgi:hypothetical protein
VKTQFWHSPTFAGLPAFGPFSHYKLSYLYILMN